MRFMYKQPRLKVVIRPAVKTHAPGSGQVVLLDRGLRAKFREHVFDSEIAQRQLGWTDEDRILVEQRLLANPRFDTANGFYLEDIAEQKAAALKTKDKEKLKLRCLEFYRDEENQSVQCDNEPLEGSEYCAAHQPVAEDEDDDELMEGMMAAVGDVAE